MGYKKFQRFDAKKKIFFKSRHKIKSLAYNKVKTKSKKIF